MYPYITKFERHLITIYEIICDVSNVT